MSLLRARSLGAPDSLASTRTLRLMPARAASAAMPPGLGKLFNSQHLSILDHADAELQELCSSKATPAEQAACWEVWKFYHDQKSKAAAGCAASADENERGRACQTLDNLERMVYEVAFVGDAEQLYKVLKTQSNMAKRAASSQQPPASKQTLLEAQKAKALEMFNQIDTDGNGVIDREEFLNAMKMLQHTLGDSEMQLIFSCMDSHGYITPEQFVDIVRAEELCDPQSDAELLRHLSHSRPGWWTDAPHCITDV